jgi:hypothetical protein
MNRRFHCWLDDHENRLVVVGGDGCRRAIVLALLGGLRPPKTAVRVIGTLALKPGKKCGRRADIETTKYLARALRSPR